MRALQPIGAASGRRRPQVSLSSQPFRDCSPCRAVRRVGSKAIESMTTRHMTAFEMLKPAEPRQEGFQPFARTLGTRREEAESSDLDRLLAAARRQMWVAIACSALALILGIAYIATTVSLFTADTSILID